MELPQSPSLHPGVCFMAPPFSSPFQLASSWAEKLQPELTSPQMAQLVNFVRQERALHKIYPPKEQLFSALNRTPYSQVKVVIVGQDPYHGPGQAHGLSFSVPRDIPQPPSLKNIFKELQRDLSLSPPSHGCLEQWADQGVLLLNACLTVRQGAPNSHQGRGWEAFTDGVIQRLWQGERAVVFLLWGSFAQKKCDAVMRGPKGAEHLVLRAPHPSPLSAHRGFFGCSHFSQTQAFLAAQGESPIQWEITD